MCPRVALLRQASRRVQPGVAWQRTMDSLSAEQRARVDRLLDELIERPQADHAGHLDQHCSDDPAVRAEVESLLHAARSAGGFLNQRARPAPEASSIELASDEIAAGMRFGAWRIERCIGRGGMGVVYEATRAQADFKQRVAIKVLLEDSAQAARFHAERQILARLQHAGIARLYDGGITAGGRPYMVMEYVEGEPITTFCQRNRLDLSGRLRLFLEVCEAVAYAHRNLVVHRDLKASNILVGADAHVKLLDFGIAKLLDTEHGDLTRTRYAPLTPACAAPEQLSGKPITTTTDVYALGLLLFELLTGRQPWLTGNVSIAQALRAMFEQTAPSVSRAAALEQSPPVASHLIRGDLDAIVAKALRLEPERRYSSVEALQRDIVHFQRAEPVQAREGARWYALGRLLRRHRWTAAGILATFIALAGGLGAAAWQARRVAVERDIARRDAAREEAVRYELTRLFHSAISQPSGEPTTAKAMIDTSAQRVLREYRDDPQRAGQIVLTLADLYGALEDVAGAAALLEGFLAQAGDDADPAVLADARQKYANIELLRGHTAHAAALLAQAEPIWQQAPRRYAEERLEGLAIRLRLERARGELDAAVITNREAIAQRVALSGRDNRETASLYNSLAITLTAANRLGEALDAYHTASAIYAALGLGADLDAQIILGNTGTLELRTGHLQAAETLLKGAIDRERGLAGDSAAVAAALGYYGRALSLFRRDAAALAALHSAVSMAERYAGAASPVALQNGLFLGEAELATGDRAGAHAAFDKIRGTALAQYGAMHALTLRSRLALARLALAEGSSGAARGELSDIVSGLRRLGPAGEANLAEALQLLGEAQLLSAHAAEAPVALREALVLRTRSSTSGYDVAVARERLGEALSAARVPEAQPLLERALDELTSELGSQHPEVLRARQALAALHGGS